MRAVRASLYGAAALVPVLFSASTLPAAAPDARSACESLANLNAPAFRVDTAQWQEANGPQPAHCLFRVTIDPRESGMEQMSYGTGIELRLPLEWNGRLLAQGGGGLNGTLNPAMGNVAGFPSALQRGFAVVSNDGGHRGRNNVDQRFAVDQQSKLDFAYQSVATTAREAKSLLARFYGRAPQYSYFMGCSTGGREAMLAAQRLPLAFDGIVAGNPSYNLTRIAMQQVWSLQQVLAIAPKNAAGEPDTSRAFSDAQLKGLADAALKRCDALDGLADGIINDYRACAFDPREQVCDAASDARGAACLTTTQANTLREILGGAHKPNGEKLYGSTPVDTGIALPAWRSMHLGVNGGQPANASLGRDTLRMFSMTPADPDFDVTKFDFDKDVASTIETAAINDAVSTLHSTFAARGSKLILYHGLSDQAMHTGTLTDWYDQLTPRSAEGPQDYARLFLVPGMTHCAGGQATDRFDMLTAIQNWVEKGEAPDRVIASGNAFPGRTRPLCPYPKVARYDGGNVEDAASFSCR